MSVLPGLVGYHGDSEISDSEGEGSPLSSGDRRPPPPGVVSSGLGIPHSEPPQGVPITEPFVRPVVHSAPSIGLVHYYGEDEEEEEDEGENMEPGVVVPLLNMATQGKNSSVLSPAGVREMAADTEPELAPTEREEETSSPDITMEAGEGGPLFLPLTGIKLPPEPVADCSPELQQKIADMLQKKNQGRADFNEVIQRRKDFRNPSIYKNLVEFCNLDEFGSNYSTEVFDPHEWTEESYYESLAAAQKRAYEKKEKAKVDRAKIEFVSSTRQPTAPDSTASSSSSAAASQEKRRRTKWDVPSSSSGGGGGGSHSSSPSRSKEPSGIGAQALLNANLINKEMMKLLQKK